MTEIHSAAEGFDFSFPDGDDSEPIADRATRQLPYVVNSEDLEYLVRRIEHRQNYHRPSYAELEPEGWYTNLD